MDRDKEDIPKKNQMEECGCSHLLHQELQGISEVSKSSQVANKVNSSISKVRELSENINKDTRSHKGLD
jgi:hypothetical protein